MPSEATLIIVLYWTCFSTRSVTSHLPGRLTVDYEYRIQEEIPVGSEVGNVFEDIIKKKGDFDAILSQVTSTGSASKPRGVNYSILNTDDAGANVFQIKTDGRLVTTKRVDRENMCAPSGFNANLLGGIYAHLNPSVSHFSHSPLSSFGASQTESTYCPVLLRILASLYGRDKETSANKPQTDSILHIRILVQDINDNAPAWPGHLKRFLVNFRDGDVVGERRTLPLAIDNDIGVNALLKYELIPPKDVDRDSSPFTLVQHPVDGLFIQATKNVDREERESYQFVLHAIDRANGASEQSGSGLGRQLTSRLVIDIQIEDINDNSPHFTQAVFTPVAPVPETTEVGKTVLVLNATDADTGINGAFHFAFSKEHAWVPAEVFARQYFDVRPNGQIVVRRPLNVDQMQNTADTGFMARPGVMQLPNEAGLLQTIHMMPLVGQTRGPTIQFRFRVMVEDEAMRPYTRSSEATVVIVVTDENDESPIIDIRTGKETNSAFQLVSSLESARFKHLLVSENQPIGTVVATIQAYDPDFGGTDHVDCHLKTPNFTLSTSTQFTRANPDVGLGLMIYHLETATELDREYAHVHVVTVHCADLDGHATEQNITVHITDINDNSPVFQRHEYMMQLEENTPPGTLLRFVKSSTDTLNRTHHSLVATDQDSGQNAEIYYTLSDSGNNASNFLIDSHSGVLSSAVVFDRETQAQYVLQVMAVDRGDPPRTGITTVKVFIIDRNDNAPQFTQQVYTFHVMENRAGAESFGQVLATDLDSGAYGSIHYYLSNDPDAFAFRIEQTTGILRTRQSLDREKQASYQFIVIARDGNGPPISSGTGSTKMIQLTGTATVTVLVDDENDNWPVFISPNATANTLAIAVDDTVGQKLAYIQAVDADEGENALVTYQIRSGNTNGLFGLDKSTGLLYLAGPLTPMLEVNRMEEEYNMSGAEQIRESGVMPDTIRPSVYTLTLEACDSGQQPRPKCTLFNNLRVFLKTVKDMEFANTEKVRNAAHIRNEDEIGNAPYNVNSLSSLSAHYNGLNTVNSVLKYGPPVFGARYTLNEIVIVCLSILFIVVLIITFLLVCLIRRRSTKHTAHNKVVAAMDGRLEARRANCRAHHLLKALNCTSPSTNVQVETTQSTECRSQLAAATQATGNVGGSIDPTLHRANNAIVENELFSNDTFTDSRYTLLPRGGTFDSQRQTSMVVRESMDISATEQLLEAANPQALVVRENGVTANPSDEYQTLDYLGLLTSTAPNRFPTLYSHSGQFTVGKGTLNAPAHSTGPSAIEPCPRPGNVRLIHSHRINGMESRCRSPNSPVNSYSLFYPKPSHAHAHSLSQANAMQTRYVQYLTQAPLTESDGPRVFPVVSSSNAQRGSGMLNYGNRMMTKSAQNVFGKQYATLNSRHPSLSHTYYDIRQAEPVTDAQLTLPKSKSQLITRRDSTGIAPLSTDVHLSNSNLQDTFEKEMNNKSKSQQLCTGVQPITWKNGFTSDAWIPTNAKQHVMADGAIPTTKSASPTSLNVSRILAPPYHESSFV